MCVRSDGKYYTDDSNYADSGNHFVGKLDGHRLLGNTLDEVAMEGRLYTISRPLKSLSLKIPM